SLNRMLEHIEVAFRAQTASEEAARRSEDAARRAAMAANRSEDRMRRFIADASHELRTPLTAIRGYAEYYRQRGGTSAPNGPGAPNGANGASTATATVPPAGNGIEGTFDLDRMIGRV